MNRSIGLLLAAIVVLCPLTATADGPQLAAPDQAKPSYAVIPIHGVIGMEFSASAMEVCLARLKDHRPQVVVLDINTPGGEINHAEAIVNLIIRYRGEYQFVAYVHRALSAGAVISMACPRIYVDDVATLGAATSYQVTSTGQVANIPADVREKFQSAWRAVARKAAEAGGHSTLMAEAMVDPDFALTATPRGGGYEFERNGSGKLVKAKGRILTMTAGEMVTWKLALGRAPNLDQLRSTLNISDWQQIDIAAMMQPSSTNAFFEQIVAKAKELGLERPGNMTEMQQQAIMKEWEKWSDNIEKEHASRVVEWELVLLESRDTSSTIQSDMAKLKRQQEALRQRLADRNLSWEDRRKLQTEFRSITSDIGEMQHYPYRVVAIDPNDTRFSVYAWVSKEAAGGLVTLGKGDPIRLRGKVAALEFWIRPDERRLIMLVAPVGNQWNCTVKLTRSQLVLAPRSQTAETPAATTNPPQASAGDAAKADNEKRAMEQVRLARSYLGAGMKDRAKEILKSVVKSYPDTEAAKEAQEDLSKL